MMATDWDTIKEFYKEHFGIDGWVVEMYANLDILVLCASGACNKSIENFLEIPQAEIKTVLLDAFDFEGWKEDLPINPYKIYCNCMEEYEKNNHIELRFISEMQTGIRSMQGMINREFIVAKSFWVCSAVYDIERKIQDEWI